MGDSVFLSSIDSSDSLKSLLSGISITSISSDCHNERSGETHDFAVSNNPKRNLSIRLSGRSRESTHNRERLKQIPNEGRYLSAPCQRSHKPAQDFNDNDSISPFLHVLENNGNNRRNQSSPHQQQLAKKKSDYKKAAQQPSKLKKEEKDKKRQEEEELGKKKRIAREKIRTWLEGKKLETMKQKELAEIAQTKENIQAANKRLQQIKAEEMYKEWLKAKKEAKIVEQQRRETERRSRELAELEKRKRVEESFQAWLRAKKANLTRRQTPYTKCISGGVVIKYFDRMAAPEPGFVNKNSWVS
ncbi:unnamed protein product [Hymenolepis diminuta]|uniref:Coiled-coil domain-containing protein n=1 Tax=Hymenolepis diminuta TaxID=6216 RepID=A0A564YQE4_HYMDI|nr:unnamed protein product [Hymenolepis diminuta]